MERKDLIILVISVLFFIGSLSSIGIFLRKRQHSVAEEPEQSFTVVEGKIADQSTPGREEIPEDSTAVGSNAFFLKPSANELLSAIRNADPLTLEQPKDGTPPMKVMWPGYFFSMGQNKLGDTIVQLDIDENGFGIVLLCTVKLADYPQLLHLKERQKIWVAGEVTSIDVTGTGTVAIDVEYIRFDEGPEAAQKDRIAPDNLSR